MFRPITLISRHGNIEVLIRELKHSSCLLLEFDGQDKPPGLVGAYKDLLTKMWSGAHQSLRAEQLAVSAIHTQALVLFTVIHLMFKKLLFYTFVA